MILTLTDLLTEYTDNTKDDSTTNTARGTRRINRAQQMIAGSGDYPWLERTVTLTTVAATKSYKLPASVRKIVSVKVTVGGIDYIADEIVDPVLFDKIDSLGTAVSSDFLVYYNIQNGNIRIYPTSGTSSLTITVTYLAKVIDLVLVDYAVGTVAVTNGSATVVGTITAWSASNVKAGGYFKISNDSYAYEILSVDSTTGITLVKPYLGTTGTGKSYKVGDSSVIPEEFHDMLWIKACSDYFLKVQDESTGTMYDNRYLDFETRLKKNTMGESTRNIFKLQRAYPIDPNDYPHTS